MRSLIVQTDKQIDFIEFHINPCLKWSDEDPWSPQEGAETAADIRRHQECPDEGVHESNKLF